MKNLNSTNDSSTSVYVTVIENKNEFIEMTDGAGMIIFQIFILLLTSCSLVVGVRGQVLFAMEQSIKPTAAQLCLFFNNLGMIIATVSYIDL